MTRPHRFASARKGARDPTAKILPFFFIARSLNSIQAQQSVKRFGERGGEKRAAAPLR
jgi:hypothetical protein